MNVPPFPGFTVPLEGYAMNVRPSEAAAVAARFGGMDPRSEADQARIVEALRRMPARDRAPAWELVMRHLGRGKPLDRAAGEIGMDLVHAEALLAGFLEALDAGPLTGVERA